MLMNVKNSGYKKALHGYRDARLKVKMKRFNTHFQ